VLVVWSDELDHIVPLCRDFNDKLMKYLWRSKGSLHSASISVATSIAPSTAGSNTNLNEKYISPPTPELVAGAVAAASLHKKAEAGEEAKKSKSWKIFGWSWTTSKADGADLEKGSDIPSPRPIRLLAPSYAGFSAGLSICKDRSVSTTFMTLI
jgi:hypothetical protein